MRTMRTPAKKKLVPFIFGHWKKKVKVLLKPMMKTKPERKRIWEEEGKWVREALPTWTLCIGVCCGEPGPSVLTFPKARSTESKYKSIPKRMKKRPKPTSPTPIPAEGGRRAELGAQADSSGPTLSCSCSLWHPSGLSPPRNALWICLQSLETPFAPAPALGRLSVPQNSSGLPGEEQTTKRKNKQDGCLQQRNGGCWCGRGCRCASRLSGCYS